MNWLPVRAAASICAGSGAMNRLTSMPASFIRLRVSVMACRLPATSSPPSVVTSSRRSGTTQTMSGLSLRAMATISGGIGHLQVEPGLDDLAQLPDIPVLDMAPVFPQVGRDAVRARRLASPARPPPGPARPRPRPR